MKLTFTDERVLAVVAHADDAELLCAGTLARARDDGAEVGMCILCRGEKGGAGKDDEEGQVGVQRRDEALAAGELLGARMLFGEVPDGELVDLPAHRRMVIELCRQFRPTLVLTHAAEDYHADHRAAAGLGEVASWTACSAGHRTASPPLESPPVLWRMDTIRMHGFHPGFYIDVSAYLDLKRRMLARHESQLARGEDEDFSPLEELMLSQARFRGAQAGVEAAEAFRLHPAWKRVGAW